MNSFTLDPRTRDDDFAFRYTGTINIATAGQHTLYLSSDDDSRLFIANVMMVNYEGLHGAGEQSGNVTLTAGNHDIRVEYFERGGGQSLTVQNSGPTIDPDLQNNRYVYVLFATATDQRILRLLERGFIRPWCRVRRVPPAGRCFPESR